MEGVNMSYVVIVKDDLDTVGSARGPFDTYAEADAWEAALQLRTEGDRYGDVLELEAP
jgi:hypothetical protein